MDPPGSRITQLLIADLRDLISVLGSDGGRISPSVYETAQVLRWFPPPEGARAGIGWLLAQQQSDGGWGSPEAPIYRDVPTLAAILALHQHRQTMPVDAAITAGLTFLKQHATYWRTCINDEIPVAFELILPRLLSDARQAGLPIMYDANPGIIALGHKRRQLIAQANPGCNTPAVFSWEAWGTVPTAQLVDPNGGVGHSPAATAAWLRMAEPYDDLHEARWHAMRYLEAAAAATQLRIPGVVPGPWPMARFEQSFGLYALLLADLLDQEALQDVLLPQLDSLQQAMRAGGLGFSDWFAPDGDNTAAALAVLGRAGRPAPYAALKPFERSTHFSAYPFEMHASLTVTARAAHALAAAGRDVSTWQSSIISAQACDGMWCGDKWNVSPLYSTCLALHALRGAQYADVKLAGAQALALDQKSDGGWGVGTRSTPQETAHAVLALYTLACDATLDAVGLRAMQRGWRYLWQMVSTGRVGNASIWISKDLFHLERADRAFILCALLAPLVNHKHAHRQRQCPGRKYAYTGGRMVSGPDSVSRRSAV